MSFLKTVAADEADDIEHNGSQLQTDLLEASWCVSGMRRSDPVDQGSETVGRPIDGT